MAYTGEQRKIASLIVQIGRRRGASRKEIISALETGLVESTLRNLPGGDGSSVGWRQETAESYPNVNRRDVRASINRYYDETRRASKQGTAGQLAQRVQRSAFPGRYDQRRGEAKRLYRSLARGGGGGSGGGGSGGGGTPGTTGGIVQLPGQSPREISGPADTALADMLAEQLQSQRQLPPSQGLQDPAYSARNSLHIASGAPTVSSGPPVPKVSLTDQLAAVRKLQGEPVPQAEVQGQSLLVPGTPGSSGDSGSGSAKGGGKGGVVTGKRGKIIGTPYKGTHTLGNWQSDHAVDITVPVGTPIYAAEDGRVTKVGGQAGSSGRFAGFSVTLGGRRDNYFYTHLQRRVVKPGQRVRRGQLIGYSGSANGVAHLHYARERGNPARNA